MKQQSKVVIAEEVSVKEVDIYINSRMVCLNGSWSWDMNCDTIFCSDVMAALSQHYTGTKGIIHPDDINYVKEIINGINKEPETDSEVNIEFRIITTYGEVKKLSGKNCRQTEVDYLRISNPEKDLLEKTAKQKEFEKGNENFYLLKEIQDHSERITKTGMWYINVDTNETYYSDNVFRIHSLTPQSLNAHPHTFSIFIHPEDAATVTEAFDKAYRDKLPLNIEYRIIVGEGTEKYLTLITHWSHNYKGEEILNGLIKDESQSVFSFTKTEQAENALDFHKQILQLTENAGNTGFWYMNLLTRQTFYSDNYYRIHGLKPQSIPARPAIFINYVHPDDRENVAASISKIRTQHAVPEIEYRILRTDKKLRYIKQKGQMLSYAGRELIMVCTIKDVTSEIVNKEQLKEINEKSALKDIMMKQSEAIANAGSWLWEPETGNMFWSDNIYELIQYKRTAMELHEIQLMKSVLPEDRKLFNDEMRSVVEGTGEREFNFRILKIGEVRNMKARFRLLNYEGRKIFIGSMQDVTEAMQLQQQLNENVQLNQLLTENILDRVFITDVHNNIILWNKKCEEYFKLKREQVIGKNYFDVFADAKNERTINRFNNVLKGEAEHALNERSQTKQYHDLHMMPLKEKSGTIVGILHVMHDVTKEMHLHNTLNERISFIEKLLEETVDRIIVLDKNFNYLYWNKKAEQHYHINKEYAIGRNLLEVFPSFVKDPFYDEFKKVLTGETVHISSDEETEHQEKFSETYLVPLLNDRNEVNGILWIVHDLSKEVALKFAEEELRKKGEHLEKINDELIRKNDIYEYAEQIGKIGTWVWNPQTNKAHYSDNMFRLFGLEPQSVEPNFETIPKFIHPEDKEKVMYAAEQLKKGKPTAVEYRIIRADGVMRNFKNRTQIVDYNNETYVIGTTQDITEIYEKELAQKTSQILLKKKDEFISIASHELKTPVTNIKASLQILQELIEHSPQEEASAFVNRSVRQANKLAELINDLLDVSVIDEGKVKLKRTQFDIREAIKESIDELCDERKDCEIKIEGEKKIEVLADRVRIQQVITNFITNAIKYSPENKTVRIKIEKNDKEVKISITDKGIGIPQDKLQNLFDRYFRVDESAKVFSGLGLGLYISKEIIKKHGGSVGVSSTEGKGSTFWFTIPL